MPIDPNVYFQQKPIQVADPLDMQNKALTMRHLAQQTQIGDQQINDDQAVRSAFQKNMKPGPDGQPQVDRAGVLSDLSRTAPMKAMEQQKAFAAQDLQMQDQKMKTLKDQIDTGKTLLAQVPTDANTSMEEKQAAWTQMKAKSQQLGMPNTDKMPDQYPGDGFVKNAQFNLLTAEEQNAQYWKDKEFQQNDLDADKGRAGNFGIISAKVESAERLQTLIHSFQSGNDLPKAQMEELALGLSNMLAPGGGGSREQVAALVPHSALGDTNKMISYLSNQPRGAGQGGFVDQIAHTIDREAATANDQLNTIRASRVGAHSTLRQMAPDAFNRQLRSYKMDPANIDENGNYKVPAGDGDSVNIKLPDGRTGTIPKANLQKAISQGAKEI